MLFCKFFIRFNYWCKRWDSNPHDYCHCSLKTARLPIPPRLHSLSLIIILHFICFCKGVYQKKLKIYKKGYLKKKNLKFNIKLYFELFKIQLYIYLNIHSFGISPFMFLNFETASLIPYLPYSQLTYQIILYLQQDLAPIYLLFSCIIHQMSFLLFYHFLFFLSTFSPIFLLT